MRGKRLSVELLLELLASGAGREETLEAYPQSTDEALTAAFSYAAKALKNELVWDVKISA